MTSKSNISDFQQEIPSRFEQLVASIDAIIWEADANTLQFTYVSHQAEKILGYPLSDWFVRNFWPNHIHPEDRAWVPDYCFNATQQKLDHQFEYRMLARDGRTVWLRDNVNLVFEDGEVTHMRGVMIDITALKNAERQFRTLVENSPDVIIRFDREGRILFVNKQFTALTGVRLEDAVGQRVDAPLRGNRSPLEEHENQRVMESIRRVAREGQPIEHEIPVWIDGQHRIFNARYTPETDESGFVVSVLYQSRDITEKFKAQRSESMFRKMLDHSRDTVEIVDAETRQFIDVNEQACVMHGYTRDEYLRLIVPDVAVGSTETSWIESLKILRRDGYLISEGFHRRKDGSVFPIEVSRSLLKLDREYVIAVVRDITQRKKTEESLKIFRTLMDHSKDSIEVVDLETARFLDVNAQACIDHGYTREEYLSLHVRDIDPGSTPLGWQKAMDTLRRQGYLICESIHRRKDGSTFPVEVNISLVRLDRDYLVSVVRDVTRRKATEQALRESHNLLKAVIEGINDAVYVKDLEGRYLMMNSSGLKYIGRSQDEVLGKTDQELWPEDIWKKILESDRRLLETNQRQIVEDQIDLGGDFKTFTTIKDFFRDASGRVVGIFGVSRETTQEKQLAEQLRQSQKMEAVGRLAGGIAHDFNNILTAICGYSQLIGGNLAPDDPNLPLIEVVLQASDRATELTSQLLAFSRKQVLQPKVLNIGDLLENLMKMMQRLIGEDITLELNLDSSLHPVKIDPGLFDQAIMNLVVNARDAMPGGGTLSIHARNVDLRPEFTATRPGMKPGQYIEIEVRDTGEGMDDHIRTHLFEPFFTTKEQGKGTGLGAPMVYGFVMQSEGHIEVDSQPGHGTSITLYLPRTYDSAAIEPALANDSEITEGSETVLVVEDESMVRSLMVKVLTAHGYTVLEASDGPEALEVASEMGSRTIDLLVTDLVMPGMNGREVATALNESRPGLRILYISGYTNEAVIRHGVQESSVEFLQKPFEPQRFVRKVREVLDAQRA